MAKNGQLPSPADIAAAPDGGGGADAEEILETAPEGAEAAGGEAAPETAPAGASAQPEAAEPRTAPEPRETLPQHVPYSRFAEVNKKLQGYVKRDSEFQTREKRYKELEDQDKFLASYFEQHPEEYARMQKIHQGKVEDLQDAREAAQDQLDTTGKIDPVLAKHIAGLKQQVEKLSGTLQTTITQQQEERAAQQHYEQFKLELHEFEGDKKYESFKGDKELLSHAVGLTKANRKPLLENLRKLADRELAIEQKTLKRLASGNERRVGARVETGGGKPAMPAKQPAKFGTDDHLKDILSSYE